MFRFFLFPSFSVLYFCVLLKISSTNETDNSSEIVANNSREQMRPLPLILHLNRSAADVFIQEANSIFVSNTSFDDLVNDNDTHQMFLRYRERQRQVRLKTIQHEILLKLGFDQEPNVTSRMSEQQRASLLSSFDRLQEIQERNDTIIEA